MSNMSNRSNLRWVIGCLLRVKGWVALAVVLMTAEMLLNTAAIWLNQQMIDDVLLGGKRDRFMDVLIPIMIAYALYSVLFTLGPHTIHHTVARLRKWLSGQLMSRMYRIPVGELQKERTASYVYHFTNDLYQTADLVGSDIPRLAQQLAGAVAIIWVMGTASPVLLAIVAVLGVMYIALGKRFAAARKQAAGAVSRSRSNLLVHLEEGVSSTREVLAFRRQAWEEKRYRSLFQSYYDSVMAESNLIIKQLFLSDPLKWLATLAVLFYGGLLVLKGDMSLGYFIVTFQFASRLMDSLNYLYNSFMGLAGRMAAVERLRGVLDGPSAEEGTVRLTDRVRDLRLEDVTFRYGKSGEQVLSGITMDLPVGRKLAIVGTSGGGKSTIASLLVRFFEPDAGEIYINGGPLRGIVRNDWAQKVTVVFQDPYLFPESIRTNLLLGLEDVTEERMIDVCQAMRIHDFIASLPDGYGTIIGERGITLSGGQRQRLALARAMLRDPEILILDEATSSLDMQTEREIQRELDERRRGRTTIIIAHRLSTIRNADVIYVFDRGHVAEQGTHEALMAQPTVYRSLVLKQSAEEAGIGA